jgi:hypothetical protein
MTNPFEPAGYSPWTPIERAQIRDYMCIPLLNASANSEMENVLNTMNGLYTNPFDLGATQARIRFWMSQVVQNDIKIKSYTNLLGASEVEDEVKINYNKAIEDLKDFGRMLIGRISRQIGLLPRDDYYEGAPITSPDGDYLSKNNYELLVTSAVARKTSAGRRSRHK